MSLDNPGKIGDGEREMVVLGSAGQNLWVPRTEARGAVRSNGPLRTQIRIRCLVSRGRTEPHGGMGCCDPRDCIVSTGTQVSQTVVNLEFMRLTV